MKNLMKKDVFIFSMPVVMGGGFACSTMRPNQPCTPEVAPPQTNAGQWTCGESQQATASNPSTSDQLKSSASAPSAPSVPSAPSTTASAAGSLGASSSGRSN